MKVLWHVEVAKRGYITEAQMWEQMYKTNTLTQLAAEFGCSINTIRDRFSRCNVALNKPGGANNKKCVIDRELIDDITANGIRATALKRGVSPQTLYQRLYYSQGLSVRKLREVREELERAEPPPETS